MLDIQIKDNFFTQKEYDILINNLDKINFTLADNGEFHSHAFQPNKKNKWLFDKIKSSFFKKNLEIYKCRFDMRHNKTRVLPHLDKEHNDYNCIIYLKGNELIYNGTGFYYNNSLHTYVGFVKNRALFFNGAKVYHTDLQGLGESSIRYTLNVFYKQC